MANEKSNRYQCPRCKGVGCNSCGGLGGFEIVYDPKSGRTIRRPISWVDELDQGPNPWVLGIGSITVLGFALFLSLFLAYCTS